MLKQSKSITDAIRSKVYILRGQQVMLDQDLAEIYGYEVKKLNQQVKRNIERFPEDFIFRLSNSEIDSVRSQIVTSRKKVFFAGQEGGRRYLPYKSEFVERFPELSLFYRLYSPLDSEMICIFPYFCPCEESAREIREFLFKHCSLLYQEVLRKPALLFLLSERKYSLWY